MTRTWVLAGPLIAELTLLIGTAGCSPAETTWSCDEQGEIAQRLSQDPSLAAVEVDHLAVASYESYPCIKGSGGDFISAGKRFTVSKNLTLGQLRKVREQFGSTDWDEVARMGSEQPGSGGDSTVCYRSSKPDKDLFLTLSSSPTDKYGQPTDEPSGPPHPLLFIELTQGANNSSPCDY